jgi:hypothetical protein
MARSWIRRSLGLAALGAALALLPPAAFGAGDDPTFHLRIDGDDAKIDVDLSLGWLAAFVDWSDFDCEVDTDRDTRRMAKSLDRQGEGGVYEFEDDDGDRVRARRVDGTLKIESRDAGGEVARVEMPWPLAECLFLGREPAGGLARALERGEFRVRVDGRDGDRLTIDVD